MNIQLKLRSTATGILGLLALTTAAASCGPPNPAWTQSLATLAPVAIANGLVFVEPARARAALLDLSMGTARVRHVAVGPNAIDVQKRPLAAEVLVLSQGERGSPGVAPVPATVTVFGVGPDNASVRRVYSVGSPFNAMALTPDGKYAVIHFQPTESLQQLLFNPNEIALIDLTREPGPTNPIARTVRSFGGIPNSVIFAPPTTIAGSDRSLAIVLSDAYITVLDLTVPEHQETTVRLTLPEDGRAVAPQQVLFDFDATHRSLFMRADRSNDVYVVRINDEPSVMGSNDFRVTINQLAAGRLPSDLALFGEGPDRRLLVVSSGSREVRVVDTTSNAITTLALDAPVRRALLFNGPSPRDANVGQRALLYSDSAADSAQAVSFVDLSAIEQRGAQNIETVQLGRPIRVALPLPERNTILFEHTVATAQGRLSLLDLHRRSTSPILAEVSLDRARFSSERSLLWVAPQSIARVGFVDLRNFHPGELRLDAVATDVLPLPLGPDGRDLVVAIHPDYGGYITLIDGTMPARTTALSVRGFLLTDALAGGR